MESVMFRNFKLENLLTEDFIIDLQSDNKKDALNEMIDLICKNEKVTDCKIFRKEIFNREKLMSTGVGYEIAVPHARHSSIKDFVMALGRKKSGIEYESIDDRPVKLIFMIGASDEQDKDYIKLLARIFLRLKNRNFVKKILAAKSTSEIFEIFKE